MSYIVEKKDINNELASLLINEAISYAKTINLIISVAIVDSAGNLVAFSKMDKANLISIGTSQSKAFTAARSTLNTKDLTLFFKQNQVDIACLKNENLMTISGGLPIFYNNEIIRGIGIGGGTGEQNEECAKHALKIIEPLI